jgi:hypothetical protein
MCQVQYLHLNSTLARKVGAVMADIFICLFSYKLKKMHYCQNSSEIQSLIRGMMQNRHRLQTYR